MSSTYQDNWVQEWTRYFQEVWSPSAAWIEMTWNILGGLWMVAIILSAALVVYINIKMENLIGVAGAIGVGIVNASLWPITWGMGPWWFLILGGTAWGLTILSIVIGVYVGFDEKIISGIAELVLAASFVGLTLGIAALQIYANGSLSWNVYGLLGW